MDGKKRQKERDNQRFERGELGALLKLFSSLGITVTAGIVGFFLLGLYLDRKAAAMGYETYGVPKIALLLLGVGLSVYWAYLRIARHLDKYEPGERPDDDEEDKRGSTACD